MTDQSLRRYPKRDIDGIFLLDKPRGISSNGALQRVKRIFGARKAGHTGSLDVLATGLLPICFGEATKVCAFLLDADKRYVSEIRLGAVTSTGDSEGEVVRRGSTVTVDAISVERALDKFRGVIQQVPPMFSALKRDGKPLYKLARRGITVDRKSRTVTIYHLEATNIAGDLLTVDVSCSKGTYIRTLAQDIGEVLECGAHVSSLRRLQAGPFTIGDAISLDELTEISDRPDREQKLLGLLLATDTALANLPDIHLTDESASNVKQGQAVRVANAPHSGLVRLYRAERQFIGIGAILDDGRIAPRRLMR